MIKSNEILFKHKSIDKYLYLLKLKVNLRNAQLSNDFIYICFLQSKINIFYNYFLLENNKKNRIKFRQKSSNYFNSLLTI